MGINLLDFVKSHLSSALMTKTAGLLGEKTADTQKAFDILLPSVLGGLANKATTLTGADNLLEMINEGGHDGRIFDNLGALLGGGVVTQGVLKIGEGAVETIFSQKTTGIADWVTAHAGIKTASAAGLMNLIAPLLMGAIGKQLDGRGSASSLIALLGSQLPYLQNVIPYELVSRLGLSNISLGIPPPKEEPAVVTPTLKEELKPQSDGKTLLTGLMSRFAPKPQLREVTPTPKTVGKQEIQPEKAVVPPKIEKPQNKSEPLKTVKPKLKAVAPTPKIEKTPIKIEKITSETNAAEKPLLQQLKPWLILLGAALFGLICLRTCKSAPSDNPSTTTVAEAPKAETPQTTTTEKTLKLTDGELKVKSGAFLDLFYTVVTDEKADLSKPLTFDKVNFEKNKTELTDSSKTQLNDLVKILKAYPKFDIKINGYTDSRGDADENKKLSTGRATAVKAYLSAHDINSDRMKTEGFGAANPVASNETDEGRVKNRRIEVLVTKK